MPEISRKNYYDNSDSGIKLLMSHYVPTTIISSHSVGGSPRWLITVSRLTVNHAQTRQELYEYARKVLVAKLERNNPGRSPQAGLRERIEFETAVLQVKQNRNLGARQASRLYYIVFTLFVNVETASLYLRKRRILLLYFVSRESQASDTSPPELPMLGSIMPI